MFGMALNTARRLMHRFFNHTTNSISIILHLLRRICPNKGKPLSGKTCILAYFTQWLVAKTFKNKCGLGIAIGFKTSAFPIFPTKLTFLKTQLHLKHFSVISNAGAEHFFSEHLSMTVSVICQEKLTVKKEIEKKKNK